MLPRATEALRMETERGSQTTAQVTRLPPLAAREDSTTKAPLFDQVTLPLGTSLRLKRQQQLGVPGQQPRMPNGSESLPFGVGNRNHLAPAMAASRLRPISVGSGMPGSRQNQTPPQARSQNNLNSGGGPISSMIGIAQTAAQQLSTPAHQHTPFHAVGSGTGPSSFVANASPKWGGGLFEMGVGVGFGPDDPRNEAIKAQLQAMSNGWSLHKQPRRDMDSSPNHSAEIDQQQKIPQAQLVSVEAVSRT